MNILVTGAAGFIGSNVVNALLEQDNVYVIGIDNINDYYDINLKQYRLKLIESKQKNNWKFIKLDISDKDAINILFDEYKPEIVINLAAQAGVRYSITNPDVYIASNIIGFYNIIEACRKYQVGHLIYASSSSVYGDNTKYPFSETDIVDKPVSLYASTKKSNELFAYTYSKLYNIKMTGLRFFTVYGPAGRPDMAYFSFTKKLISNEKIKVFNNGECKRDFTYIDDIVDGIINIVKKGFVSDGSEVPYSIYNIGRGKPEGLLDFIKILYKELVSNNLLQNYFDLDKHIELLDMQPGDVAITYADTSKLGRDYNYFPKTDLSEGLHKFVKWYQEYYNIERHI